MTFTRANALDAARQIFLEMSGRERCPDCHSDEGHADDCQVATWLRLFPAEAPAPDLSIERSLSLGLLAMRLSGVFRATKLGDGRKESDADHTIALILIACSIASSRPGLFDVGRVAELATVHDLPEVICGDVNTLGMSEDALKAKASRDAKALEQLLFEYSDEAWLCSRLVEYEEQRSPEARLVRYVDKLLPKVTHILNGGLALDGLSPNDLRRAAKDQRARLANEYPELASLLDPLFEELSAHAVLSLGLRRLFGSSAPFLLPPDLAKLHEVGG